MPINEAFCCKWFLMRDLLALYLAVELNIAHAHAWRITGTVGQSKHLKTNQVTTGRQHLDVACCNGVMHEALL